MIDAVRATLFELFDADALEDFRAAMPTHLLRRVARCVVRSKKVKQSSPSLEPSLGTVALLVFVITAGTGCGYSNRIGPQMSVANGEVAVGAAGTVSYGLSSTDPQFLAAVPITVGGGVFTKDGSALVTLESGLNVSWAANGDDALGFRFGPRGGGILTSRESGYAGMRGGPCFALEPREKGTQELLTLSIEGFVNKGFGDVPIDTYGIGVSIGWDRYTKWRLP